MYLLDTNACIRILKKSSLSVVERLRQQDSKDIKLCSITAKAHDLIVVTHNVDEFSRVEGLQVEDWE